MADYPNIADHGLIGDLQTAALIDTDGTLDWFCAPRFDSPSLFGSLLDAERGGYCRVRPETDDYVSRQLYLPNTAILVTRFMTEEGVGELIDFMPVEEGEATDRHRIVRVLRVVRGTMSFVAEVKPKFDYGRASHRIVPTDGAGAQFVSDDLTLTLHRVGDPVLHGTERAGHIELSGDGIRVTGSLNAGEMAGVMLETGGAEPRRIPRGRDERDATRHHALLAGLEQPLHVPRAVARDGRPLGDHPQADDLRADGRTRGGPDGGPARAGGRRAQLGLPLHVDPRRILLGLRAARARLHRGGGGVRRVADGPRARERRQRAPGR